MELPSSSASGGDVRTVKQATPQLTDTLFLTHSYCTPTPTPPRDSDTCFDSVLVAPPPPRRLLLFYF